MSYTQNRQSRATHSLGAQKCPDEISVASSPSHSLEKYRVAIVDDEASLRMVFSYTLEEMGLQTRTFEDPRDFLEEQIDAEIDLVLLDLRMPGMSGLAVLRELSRRNAQLPVILCSANLTDEVEKAAKVYGVDGFLDKPCNPNDLREEVIKILSTA